MAPLGQEEAMEQRFVERQVWPLLEWLPQDELLERQAADAC